jgi:hypothetical protein
MPRVRATKLAALFACSFGLAVLLAVLGQEMLGAEDGDQRGDAPPDIVEHELGKDETGIIWRRFTVQGVDISIPGDEAGTWLVNLNTDICDPLRAQYLVIEHAPTAVRFRLDLDSSEVRYNKDPDPSVQSVVEKILSSRSGAHTGDPRLSGSPRPTPITVCDKVDGSVPPIVRGLEPDPNDGAILTTATTEPSSTPEPMPPPVEQ